LFIRIHEKPKLDHKADKFGLICLQGQHVDRQGNVVADMNAPHEIFEEVLSISYAMGSEMDPDTQVIMTIIA